jgi:S1-C subfamily serine protease
MAVHEIVLTAAFVFQLKAGAQIGTASGFFYTRGEDLFLVTNRHVCRDEATGSNPDVLRLTLHTDANDLKKTASLDIPLYHHGKPVWRTHPTFKDADVALVKLDVAAVKKKFIIKAFSKDSFLPADLPLNPGEDVFVMGYPYGVHDTVFALPIFRSAMIASSYGIPFQGQPFFLTDANLHPGTSGSPVVTKPKSAWVDDKGNTRLMTGTIYYLVGVHSAILSVNSTGPNPTSIPLGLGTAWYAQLIEDIAGAAP